MKTKTLQRILFAFTLLFALTFLSPPMAHADTDGTEIQVLQPERLEIQLGTAWAGVEFQLRTDSGLYPDPIPVGEDEERGVGRKAAKAARGIERLLPPGVEARRHIDLVAHAPEILRKEIERDVAEQGDLHASTRLLRKVEETSTNAAAAERPAPKPARSARPAPSVAARVSGTEQDPGFANRSPLVRS